MVTKRKKEVKLDPSENQLSLLERKAKTVGGKRKKRKNPGPDLSGGADAGGMKTTACLRTKVITQKDGMGFNREGRGLGKMGEFCNILNKPYGRTGGKN